MMAKMTHKRAACVGRTTIRCALTARSAAEATGTIKRGCEIYGLSKGQFSLIDIITHCLEATGAADAVLSTWTAAGADLRFAYKLMTEGSIRSLRFLVDFSFPSRQPAYCAALRETFGGDCIRISKNHAKFVLIRNSGWNIVIRSSMNLNENRRLESFEISDDKGMADFLEDVISDTFDEQPAGGQFGKRPIDHIKDFEALGEVAPTGQLSEAAMKSTDMRKFYSDVAG